MPYQKITIAGFAPDLPQDTPGILVDSQNIVPTTRGIANGNAVVSTSTSVATGPCLGAATLTLLAGQGSRLLCGTASKLYELNVFGGSLIDVSGSTYSVGTGNYWSFDTFGNVSLAANLDTTLQASTAIAATFAAVTGAPKAAIVTVCGEPNASFAMCFNYDDGSNAYSDGVFWSALGDYTDWTPSIATQSGNVRLLDVNGGFTAAIAFRNGVVAFKSNAMYLGAYVGGAAVWSWERVSNQIGCAQPGLVCEAEDVLFFIDGSGLWTFDGSYPRPAPGYVGDFLAARIIAGRHMRWDAATRNLWVPYKDGSSTSYLVYNLRSGLWTRHGVLTDGTENIGILYDVATALGDGSTFGAFLMQGSGTPAQDPYFRLGAIGSPGAVTTVSGVRPQFLTGPTDSAVNWLSGTLYYGPSLRNVTAANVAMTVDTQSADAHADRLDVLQAARFLSPKVTVAKGTTFEVRDVYVNARDAGAE